jgi:protein-disulfide isomerase
LEKEMDQVTNTESRPFWRHPLFMAGVLLVVISLAVAACALPGTQPDDPQAVTEPAAAGEDPDPVNVDTGNPDSADPESADTNPADQFAVDQAPTETYLDIPVGITASGLPYRGDPDAPVIMVEYSDYQCPFCGRHFVQTEPALTEKYVRDGQVRMVFIDFPLEQLHPNAPRAHEAGLCVLAQGSAANYWKMHGELFRSGQEWGGSLDPLEVYTRLAEEAGADMDAFNECMENGEQRDAVAQQVDRAMQQGFGGTPSFQLIRVEDGAISQLVGAQPFDQFEAQIDLLLSGESPQVAEQQSGGAADIPFWATEEGWQPDPDRPGYNMAGDQYKGSLDAPITIIEFSDLECPFCKRHTEQTQPTLDEQYVDTGKVLWVFKHFPLDIHPGAAAECAAEQGQFWEMVDLLFERQSDWSTANPVPVLTEIAEELGLDGGAFTACIEDDEIADRVISDLQDGTPFVRGTPTFIVLHQGEGSIIPGALPAESFTQVLDEILAEGETD